MSFFNTLLNIGETVVAPGAKTRLKKEVAKWLSVHYN